MMTGSRLPRNSAAIEHAIRRITTGVTLNQGDIQAIVEFMNTELPRFEQATDTYLVLGSYRDQYGIRLRKFAHRLDLPSKAAAIVLGDTMDLDTDLEFDIKINLLGTAADHIVGVYEKESGGECPELGFIRALFIHKTYVFPRDYTGLNPDSFETKEDVIIAALEIYFATDTDDEKKRDELLRLLTETERKGIDISERELVTELQTRSKDISEVRAGYNWVLLSLFRRFERMGHCFPWISLNDLLSNARHLPRYDQPKWERPYTANELFDDRSE